VRRLEQARVIITGRQARRVSINTLRERAGSRGAFVRRVVCASQPARGDGHRIGRHANRDGQPLRAGIPENLRRVRRTHKRNLKESAVCGNGTYIADVVADASPLGKQQFVTEKPWWRDWRQSPPEDWQDVAWLKVLVVGLGVVAVAGSVIALVTGHFPAAALLLG